MTRGIKPLCIYLQHPEGDNLDILYTIPIVIELLSEPIYAVRLFAGCPCVIVIKIQLGNINRL